MEAGVVVGATDVVAELAVASAVAFEIGVVVTTSIFVAASVV